MTGVACDSGAQKRPLLSRARGDTRYSSPRPVGNNVRSVVPWASFESSVWSLFAVVSHATRAGPAEVKRPEAECATSDRAGTYSTWSRTDACVTDVSLPVNGGGVLNSGISYRRAEAAGHAERL